MFDYYFNLKSTTVFLACPSNVKTIIQYTSESRTGSAFEWSISAGPDHLISGPFETRTQKSGFLMVLA
jgi:hypothetical protein